MNNLRQRVFNRIGNISFLPQNHVDHMTICITTDFEKAIKVKEKLENSFIPFHITIISLGLYSIWPGKLISVYGIQNI